MFALGESIPIVMAEGGWADPKVALTVYAHAMRRDDAENEALRTLVEGSPIGSSGSGADLTPLVEPIAATPKARNPLGKRAPGHGPYWARTSDLRLVEPALSQLS